MSDSQSQSRVAGERTTALGSRVPAESRVSNLLALGLMGVLGLGALTWYYAHALTRPSGADVARAAATQRAQSEMPLPGLGRIDAPRMPPPFEPAAIDHVADPPPAPRPLVELSADPNSTGSVTGMPPPKTPAELALERKLAGAVFVAHGLEPVAASAMARLDETAANAVPGGAVPRGGDLADLLSSPTKPGRAQMLPEQRLLLPKGAFVDCTLETAIDSTLPGMTTCVMATDAFGVDGTVVLLERGTKLIGETRGQVQQGAARIFVVWTEARTPMGVIVPLDSPGADELGRSGLPGDVNRHFWQRFGAAMLVSVIDGAVQAAAESSRNSGGTVVVAPQASQEVLTEILRNTINIPPTVVKRNGDKIQVLVARDVDFRSVYALRSTTGR